MKRFIQLYFNAILIIRRKGNIFYSKRKQNHNTIRQTNKFIFTGTFFISFRQACSEFTASPLHNWIKNEIASSRCRMVVRFLRGRKNHCLHKNTKDPLKEESPNQVIESVVFKSWVGWFFFIIHYLGGQRTGEHFGK